MANVIEVVLRAKDQSKSAINSLKTGLASLKPGFENVSNAAKKFTTAVSGIKDSILDFKNIAGVAIGYKFVTSILQANVELERLNSTLRFSTGSSEAAAESFRYVSSRSRELGLNFRASANAFAKFTAAAKGTNLEGEQAREIFDSVAVASRVLSLSAEDTEGALRALEQMVSKGNVQAEELRGQLGERLPGAFNLAAKAMGVTTAKLNDMLQKGEVLASDLLPKLAKELQKAFGPYAQEAAEGLGAQMERLSFQWENLKASILSVGSSKTGIGYLEQFIGGLAILLGSALDPAEQLRQQIDEIAKTIEDAKMGKDWRVLFDADYITNLNREYAALVEKQAQMAGLVGKREANPSGNEAKRGKIARGTQTEKSNDPVERLSDDEKLSAEVARFLAEQREKTMREFYANIEEMERDYNEKGKASWDEWQAIGESAMDGVQSSIEETNTVADSTLDQYVSAWEDANSQALKSAQSAAEFMKGVWQQAGRSIQSTISDMFYEFEFSFKGLVDVARKAFADILAALVTSGLKDALMSVFGMSSGSGFGAILSSLGFAAGGGSQSTPFWAGEDGRELIVPGSSGARVFNERQLAFAGGQQGTSFSPVTNITLIERDDPEQTKKEVLTAVARENARQQSELNRRFERNGIVLR